MIPKGVTVRKMGEPSKRARHSVPWLASRRGDVDVAKNIVCYALDFDPESPLAKIHLSEQYRWARIDPSSRLMEIAAWLHAECYEAMDLVESAPVSTIGD